MQDYINDTNHIFKKEWITDRPDPNFVEFAKHKGRLMAGLMNANVAVEKVEELLNLGKNVSDYLKRLRRDEEPDTKKTEDFKKTLIGILGEQPKLNGKTGKILLKEIRLICSRNGEMSNSQIRNVYGEIKRIQMIGNFEKSKVYFYLLKPKMAYAYGRSNNNPGMRVFKEVFDMASDQVTDEKTFQNFCNVMEAILAYHRAFGAK